MGYTPGPWTWDKNDTAATGATNSLVVRPAGESPHGRWVADVGRLHDPEAEANARLIAAAPDLLKAVRGLLDVASAAGLLRDDLQMNVILPNDTHHGKITQALDTLANLERKKT